MVWKQNNEYKEMTAGVRARIAWIREDTKFLNDTVSHMFPHVRATTRTNRNKCEYEIKYLLRKRREYRRKHGRVLVHG